MNTRKYQAPTIGQALAEVKRDLGRDAVILRTRRFRKGGLFGIGGRRTWEIVAAENARAAERPVTGRYVRDEQPPQAAAPAAPAEAQGPPLPPSGVSKLAQQIQELRGAMEALLASRGSAQDQPSGPLRRTREALLAQDVAPRIAEELTRDLGLRLTGKQLADESLVRKELCRRIAARIRTQVAPAAGGRTVMAFVGPTGVGKTTTIAKLAAGFKLTEHKRVGLITIDTYRIAAVDQLRTYADIVEVPLRAVLSPGELDRELHRMADLDVVLIDTTGRSPGDWLKLSQLRSFLSVVEADEVHLVVSATSSRSGIERTLEKFRPLGFNRIILSKTDEAATFGAILSAAAGGVPLSYCTCGQEVPDDIAPARAQDLAKWVVGDS